MKVTYDPEVDIVHILFSNTPIEESDEERPGVMENPRAREYAVAG